MLHNFILFLYNFKLFNFNKLQRQHCIVFFRHKEIIFSYLFFLVELRGNAEIFDRHIMRGMKRRNPHDDLGPRERIPAGISKGRATPKLSVRAWRASGRRSFYFPSISFLSGFPSAFPLILKQERSLARAVSKRVAAVCFKPRTGILYRPARMRVRVEGPR